MFEKMCNHDGWDHEGVARLLAERVVQLEAENKSLKKFVDRLKTLLGDVECDRGDRKRRKAL